MRHANVYQAQVAVKVSVNVEALSDHELVAAARDVGSIIARHV